MLAIVIIARLVFIASLVFILGYIFGNFSKKPALARITKVAALFLVVSFIAGNILFFRWSHGWRHGNFNKSSQFENHCFPKDTTTVK